MQSNLNGDFLKVNKDLWRDLQALLDSLKKYTLSADRSAEDSILLVLSKIFASYEDNNIESSDYDDDVIIAVQSFLIKYVNSDTTIYALHDCIFHCYCTSIDESHWSDWDVSDELITNTLISSEKRDLRNKNYATWMINAMTSNLDAYFPGGVYYAELCLDLKELIKRINDTFKLNAHEISSNERLLCRLLTLFERIGYYKVTAETTLVMAYKYFLHEYIDETKLAYYALMRLTFTTYSEISWASDYADRVLIQLEELVCGQAWKELGLLPKLLPYQYNLQLDNRPRCPHTDFESGFFGPTDSDKFEISNEVVFECECNRAFYCSERCRVNCIRSHFPICCRIREKRLKEKRKDDIESKLGVDNSFVTISQFLLVAQRGWLDSICSLRSLGACCRLFKGFFHTSSFAKIILNTNLEKLVQKFGFDSLTDFNDILRQEKIALAGSTPLQALLGEDFGDATDMDFYIVMDEAQDYYLSSRIHFHLENIGYTCTRATSGSFRYDDWLFQNAYHQIHYYSNKGKGKAIQVMCVKKTTATTGFKDVVNLYDFSFVQNWYDGHHFYFLFPDDCITKTGNFSSNRLQSIIDLKISLAQRLYCCPVWDSRVLRESGCFADIKTLEKHFLRILERTRKYEGRGFIIVGPQVPRRSNFINGEKDWILYGGTAEFQAFNYLSLNDY